MRDLLIEFTENLPRKPYCTNDFSDGTRILPLSMALTYRYMQLNPPPQKSFMVFDIDRPGAAWAAEDADLPVATLTVVNPANKHAHLIYVLSSPVCTSPYAHEQPQRYLEAIEDAYRERLGADLSYAGLLAKNPWHSHWDTLENGNAVYSLSALAEYVELPFSRQEQKTLRANVLGRNCTLFDTLRHWAYAAIKGSWKPEGEWKWHEAVLSEALRLNVFEEALPVREVKSIARSVARWTWRHIKPVSKEYIERTHTPETQRSRINKRWEKESKKKQGLELMQKGENDIDIAVKLCVSERTVERWRMCFNTSARYHGSDNT
jgi:hypothetical protein